LCMDEEENMDDRDWQIITTLAKSKNITKTANLLYISQPALTARLKQIEAQLGVTLFLRSNKGVQLTPQGEFAARFAKHLLSEIAEFEAQLSDLGSEVAGVLRLAVTSIVGRYYLPKMLEEFQKRYPKVRFEILIRPTPEVLKMVKGQEAAFGFPKRTTGFAADESLKLLSYGVYAASTQPFKIEDLPHMRRIEYPYEEYYNIQLKQWWNERFKVQPLIGSRVPNLDMSVEMAYEGMGYAFLPEVLVRDAPRPLYAIPLQFMDGSYFQRDTYVVFSKNVLDGTLPMLFYRYLRENNFSAFNSRGAAACGERNKREN